MARITIPRRFPRLGKMLFLAWAILSSLAAQQLMPSRFPQTGEVKNSPHPAVIQQSDTLGVSQQASGVTANPSTDTAQNDTEIRDIQGTAISANSQSTDPATSTNAPGSATTAASPVPTTQTPSGSSSPAGTSTTEPTQRETASQPEPEQQPILMCIVSIICI